LDKDQIANLRQQYGIGTLNASDLLADPMEQFKSWFAQAQEAKITEPNAMILSTVNKDAQPTARTVLLKELSTEGFVFYTNYDSDKGHDMAANPKVSLTFLWLGLERQVRIQGLAERSDEASSTKYFQSRPKASQLGAWASPQSKQLESRAVLEERLAEFQAKYANEEVLPKPPHWGGYLIRPNVIEFWQGRASRLHDRFVYRRMANAKWEINRIAP